MPSRGLSGTMPDCCDKIALGHASAREPYGASSRVLSVGRGSDFRFNGQRERIIPFDDPNRKFSS